MVVTYLVGDVRPVVLATQVFQILLEKGSHLNDSVCHALKLTQPLLSQGRVVHDGRRNASTVNRGVRPERTDEDLDLRFHALFLLGRFADEGEGSDTLTIETLHLRSIQ